MSTIPGKTLEQIAKDAMDMMTRDMAKAKSGLHEQENPENQNEILSAITPMINPIPDSLGGFDIKNTLYTMHTYREEEAEPECNLEDMIGEAPEWKADTNKPKAVVRIAKEPAAGGEDEEEEALGMRDLDEQKMSLAQPMDAA